MAGGSGINLNAATMPRTNPNMRLFPLQDALIDVTDEKKPKPAWYTRLKPGDRMAFRLVDISNLSQSQGPLPEYPSLALVDTGSYWVHGFFKESLVGQIRSGNRAVVTLMTYPDTPLAGVVDSVGWGIAQEDGSTGFDLLPTVSPTFQWIRLAQRVPVRVHLDDVPDGIELRVGTTASVLVMSGTDADTAAVQPVPVALQ